MIIPRFLLSDRVTLIEYNGVNGRGQTVTTERWTKPCKVDVKQTRIKSKDGICTIEKQYMVIIEKSDIKIGDILRFKGIDIEIIDIPDPDVHSSDKYIEVIGYGQKV